MNTRIYEQREAQQCSALHAGHAQRVAEYARRLASAVNSVKSGPLAEYRFSEEDIAALTYAALLHESEAPGEPAALSRTAAAILAMMRKKLLSRKGVYEPESDPVTLMGHILSITHIYDRIAAGRDYLTVTPDFDTAALILHLEAGKKALDQDIVDLFLEIL